MTFSGIDAAAVSRTLSQLAEHDDDVVDAYFERREELELAPEGEAAGLRIWREQGFAIRLSREGKTWLASRDEIAPRPFAEALRQVARALPSTTYPEPSLAMEEEPGLPEAPEVLGFPAAVSRAVRAHHVGFPFRLTTRRHRREIQVVGPKLVSEPQTEVFWSCVAEAPWGRHGALLPRLDAAAANSVAAAIVALFRARQAEPPAPVRGPVVLGPAAVAVLLHEAVAHALEADSLAQGGNPEAAVGVQMGASFLDVLDDPGAAPEGVRRTVDDEGSAVVRRWLLRGGIVEQPIADSLWAHTSPVFMPGAARRGSRHLPPGPRSTYLEILPGETPEDDLLADARRGLFLPEATSGNLDVLSGDFTLRFPFGRRIKDGVLAEVVGPCAMTGRVADILGRIAAVGDEARLAGAGWCAKGGQKLPVWAAAPPLRLEGVDVA